MSDYDEATPYQSHILTTNGTIVTAIGQKKKEPFAYLPYFHFTFYMNFALRRAAIIFKFWHNCVT